MHLSEAIDAIREKLMEHRTSRTADLWSTILKDPHGPGDGAIEGSHGPGLGRGQGEQLRHLHELRPLAHCRCGRPIDLDLRRWNEMKLLKLGVGEVIHAVADRMHAAPGDAGSDGGPLGIVQAEAEGAGTIARPIFVLVVDAAGEWPAPPLVGPALPDGLSPGIRCRGHAASVASPT
jgi:hypothetical protein